MNVSGKDIIASICNRLEAEKILTHDGNIIQKLRSLSSYELHQLIDFGDVPSWHNDRINKAMVAGADER